MIRYATWTVRALSVVSVITIIVSAAIWAGLFPSVGVSTDTVADDIEALAGGGSLDVKAGPEPSVSLNQSAVERAFRERLNEKRRENGLSALGTNPDFRRMAQDHSEWMAKNEKISHVEDGATIADRYAANGYDRRCGYRDYGAEVAFEAPGHLTYLTQRTADRTYSEATADRAFEGFMDSPPHREALMSSKATEMGLGYAWDGNADLYLTVNLC